jgi:phage terminase small subunit
MLYCVIHDIYFKTLSEFEAHVEEHQRKSTNPTVESQEQPVESVTQQGE